MIQLSGNTLKITNSITMVALATMLVIIMNHPSYILFLAIPICITGYIFVYRPFGEGHKKIKDDLLSIPPKAAKR